jgi:hypothetical protein
MSDVEKTSDAAEADRSAVDQAFPFRGFDRPVFSGNQPTATK